MLKIIGAILIIGAFGALGFSLAENLKKRLRELKELQRCLMHLQTEIEFTHTALPNAMKRVAEKSVHPLAEMFNRLSEILQNNEVEDVHEGMKLVIKENKDKLHLSEPDLGLLLDLSKSLGETDIYGQKKSFSLILDNIKNHINSAEDKALKNVKVYRYLGITIGCMIVIMLL